MRAASVRVALLLGLCAAISGCATTATAPGTISVAVATPCQTDLPPRPAMPVDSVAMDADIWTMGTALWAERQIREAYEIALATRLKGCIEAP